MDFLSASDGRMDTSVRVNPEPIELSLPEMKTEIWEKAIECRERGLSHSFKFLSELLYTLREVKVKAVKKSDECREPELFNLVKSYFDLKEYDRAEYFAAQAVTDDIRVRFLRVYAKYLSGEKKRLDNQTDNIANLDATQMMHLKDIRARLIFGRKNHDDRRRDGINDFDKNDGYMQYLYGVVLKKLGLVDDAKEALQEAIALEPCHWGAWLELSYMVSDRASLASLRLPDHWMKHFFLAHCYLELLLNDQAIGIYHGLMAAGLEDSTYIIAQEAIAHHNKRDLDKAVERFKLVEVQDPYRLDNLDTYSNVLYVKEQREELAHLAHRTVDIDKYRPETCCVVGNYYGLRSQHEKAVQYFQRALKLNPKYLSAWTLMGHEYMELKNKSAAIQSYRHAIEVNPRDYRAWYGLGQTYEILKMNYYCLYYYKKAQELRPNDSRMLMALGESYEKLDKLQLALKCYWKAHCLGDLEHSMALFNLARLYERTGDVEQAAAAYFQYIDDLEVEGKDDRDNQSRAHRYLAQYFLKQEQLDDAYTHAQRCTEFPDTREEGKALLKEIASKRGRDLGGQNPEDGDETTTPSRVGIPKNASGSFVNPISPEDGVGVGPGASNSNNQDEPGGGQNGGSGAILEPMNLTFTP